MQFGGRDADTHVCVGRSERDLEAERAAATELAVGFDGSAHQLRELKRDRQAETGAAELAGCGCVGLSERVEQRGDPVRRDPDARIANLEAHRDGLRRSPRNAHFHNHLPLRGELDRVGHQVGEDLADAHSITADHARHVVVNEGLQLQSLRNRGGGDRVAAGLHHVVQVEVAPLNLKPTGLDLRDVENVIDHRHQRVAGRARHVDVLALLVVEVRVGKEVDHPDHPVQRSPDLVAHVRNEVGLHRRCVRGREDVSLS